MKNRLHSIFIFLVFSVFCLSGGNVLAAKKESSQFDKIPSAQVFSHLLQVARHNADLPAPNMLPEPVFTTSRSNTVFWEITYTPAADDSILLFNAIAEDQTTGQRINQAQSFSKHYFLFVNLNPFHTYYFRAQLVRVKKGGSVEIGDLSPVPAISMPDNRPPDLVNISLVNGAAWKGNWTNGNSFQITAALRDTSGIDSVFLYLRTTPGGGWSLFKTQNFDSVYVATAQFQTGRLLDGYYEIAATGKDNSHAPESHGAGATTASHWVVEGNKGQPAAANLNFHVDVTSPDTVTISVQQRGDVLLVSWTPAVDPGIGLEGYKIVRNGELLATVSGQTGTYRDSLNRSLPMLPASDAVFTYQVQPFDSLGNTQTKGVGKAFHYWRKPRFYPEPAYTAGDQNTVCWHAIPGTDHYILEWSDNENFVASLHSIQATDTCYTITNLKNGEKVFYRLKQVQPDGGETAWSDTIESVQDQTPPTRTAFHLAELDSSQFYHGWYNRSTLHFSVGFTDSAGIDSIVFWEKSAVAEPWRRFVAHGSYDSSRVVSDEFVEKFGNGTYYFYVSARDFAHAPVSRGGNLQVEGNLEIPGLSTHPLAEIKIDTRPPMPVTVKARQMEDRIALTWNASADSAGGIGLKGYKIFRDGTLIAELVAKDTSFTDIFSPLPKADHEFSYQVQPEDSLGNRQTAGGRVTIWYRANPVMYAEPSRTAGTQNQVCWKPKPETAKYRLQIALDSLFQNGVVTLDVIDTCAVRSSLKDGQTYYYRVRQIRLNGSETGWSNVVWSTQDAVPPEINAFTIAERDSAGWKNGWYNKNTVHMRVTFSDPSGLDSIYLYSRVDATTPWRKLQTRAGLDSVTQLTTAFDTTLQDGWYEFFVGARDYAHAAISHEGRWFVLGNKRMPQPGDTAQAAIRIDTTPPSAVSLSIVQKEDVIQLHWTVSKDAPLGIGLAGYKIIRGDSVLATVGAGTLSFNDTLKQPPVRTTSLEYQIQPFDALGNVQMQGGQAQVLYKPRPRLFAEPYFTAGTKNVVCWASDDDANYFVVQKSTDPDFLSNVDSLSVTDTCATFNNLTAGTLYYYRVREVRKTGGLTGWSNCVFSRQDDVPPKMQKAAIAEADSDRWLHGWFPGNIVHIQYSAVDSAGVDSVVLWKQPAPGTNFQLFDAQPFDSLAFAEGVFTENLPDGRYFFFLSARDFAHAPESQAGKLLVQGNETLPTKSTKAQLFVFIDTTPPDSVSNLQGSQAFQNVIQFQWNSGVLDAGIGVEGFHVYRNGQRLATLPGSATTFHDTITGTYSAVTPFHYRIVAFDSLGNENASSGKRTILFYPPVERVAIVPEPAFTPGHSNMIFWHPIYISATYTAQCSSDSTFKTVLEEKTTPDTSVTFENLKDNGRYFFRVKAVDKFQREVNWSQIVSSRQDASPPQVLSLSPLNTEQIDEKAWIYGNSVLQLSVGAQDQGKGKIVKILIFENGTLQDSVQVVPIHNLQSSFSVTLKNPPNTAIEVCLKVVDAAGNVSEARCTTVYWEQLNETIVAFPNPFNPNSGKKAIIRVKDKNVKEVWIYDYFGNLVRILREKVSPHDFVWDGKNGHGDVVGNGGYLCVIHGSKDYYKIAVLK